jgi:HEAT repeat protein
MAYSPEKFAALVSKAGYKSISGMLKTDDNDLKISRQTIYNFLDGENVSDRTLRIIAEMLDFDSAEEFIEELKKDEVADRDDLETMEIDKASSKHRSVIRDSQKLEAQNIETVSTDKGANDTQVTVLEKKLNGELYYRERTLIEVHRDLRSHKTFTVSTILKNRKNCIITGESGIGKTTLLQKISIQAIKTGRIPIYVDLKFCRAGNLEEFKEEIITQALLFCRASGISLKINPDHLENRDAVVLFDHVEYASRETILLIHQFASHYDCLCIAAYRGNAFNPTTARLQQVFITLSVGTFHPSDIVEILERQGIFVSEIDYQKREQLFRIGANPYQLNLILQILKNRKIKIQDLDLNRNANIFYEAITCHIRNEMQVRTHKHPLGLKLDTLAALAFEIRLKFVKDTGIADYLWAEDVMFRCIARQKIYDVSDATGVIDEIKREGLIVLSSDGQFVFFVHDALFDFLSAWHLCKEYDNDTLKKLFDTRLNEERLDLKWRRSIVFYASFVEDASFMIQILIDKSRDDIFLSNFHLAVDCLSAARNISPELGKEVSQKLINGYFQTENPVLKKRFFQGICSLQDKYVISHLNDCLESPLPHKVDEALQIIKERMMSSAELVSPLLRLLKQEEDALNSPSAKALIRIGTEDAIAPFLPYLEDHNMEIRLKAARVLLQCERAQKHLLRMLQNEDIETRMALYHELEGIDTPPEVEDEYLETLKTAESDGKREALIALHYLGTTRSEIHLKKIMTDQVNVTTEFPSLSDLAEKALFKVNPKLCLETLVELFANKDEQSQLRSVTSLMLRGSDNFADRLIHPSGAVRTLRMFDETVINTLLSEFEDVSHRIQDQILRVLGSFRSMKSIQAILDCLEHPDPRIRIASIREIMVSRVSASDHVLMPAVFEKLDDPDESVRILSGRIRDDLLFGLKEWHNLPDFLEGIYSPPEFLRPYVRTVVQKLELNSEAFISKLKERLKSKDDNEQFWAFEFLKYVEFPSKFDFLLTQIDASDSKFVRRVINTLGFIEKTPEQWKCLKEEITRRLFKSDCEDPRPFIRGLSFFFSGAEDILIDFAKEKDYDVLEDVLDGLRQAGGKKSIIFLIQYLNGDYSENLKHKVWEITEQLSRRTGFKITPDLLSN